MATATKEDLSKLKSEDLVEKLNSLKPKVQELTGLEARDQIQDNELIDLLDECDEIQNVIETRKREDLERRVKRLASFDARPNARKTGGNSGTPEDFDCLGERLHAVAQFRLTGTMDPRLRNALGANESTPSEGGFLVGSDEQTELNSKMYGEDSWLGLIPRTPISAASNMLKLRLLKETSRADGSRQGGVQAYWEGEAQSTTATRPEFEDLELTLKKLMALGYATSELLEDHSALEAEMTAGYNEEMTFKLGDSVVNGNGVNKPAGILNAPCKITVSAETGQTTLDPLNYENIVKMWARLHPRSQMSAVWFVDQSLIPYLFTMGLQNGTAGTPVYLPPGGASGSPYGTLMGRPVIHTEFTQAANTEGDIILWDPTQYRLIEKGGIRGASSMHVAFTTDEWAFRFTYRTNGAPKWRSPLTPKNGGPTLSTIVTLATRT
ncbi:MAG: phage major capsid protein [Pirellulales bacterium]